MEFSRYAALMADLESVSGRYEKVVRLAKDLKSCSTTDLVLLPLAVIGRIFPAHDPRDLGISSKSVVRALSKAFGKQGSIIEDLWRNEGDLGKVAANLTVSQSSLLSRTITLAQVYDELRKFPSYQGKGSVDLKIAKMVSLISQADRMSVMALIRLIIGDLRAGMGESNIRDAILAAFVLEEDASGSPFQVPRELSDRAQCVLDVRNDLGELAVLVRKHPQEFDASIAPILGRPVKSMLAQRSAGLEDGLSRTGMPCFAEYKYDGFRVQIHKDGDQVRFFTRRLDDVTTQFEEMVAHARTIRLERCIIDCEFVGYAPDSGRLVPFQMISQRIRRKYGIEELARTLPVKVIAFDIIASDVSLLATPFEVRRKVLSDAVPDGSEALTLSESVLVSSMDDAASFYARALDAGFEGIMLKTPAGIYKPGSRVGHMVKVKPTLDTIDCVIVGGEYGEGKRASWISSFIVAVRSDDGLVTIGRVGSGLKEKESEGFSFEMMTRLLEPLVEYSQGRSVRIRPEVIVEVACEEIQSSDAYDSGYALRFPRIIRVREDKGEIMHLSDVEEMFRSQRARDR